MPAVYQPLPAVARGHRGADVVGSAARAAGTWASVFPTTADAQAIPRPDANAFGGYPQC